MLGPTVLKRKFDCWKILGSRGDFPSVDARGGGTDDDVAAHTAGNSAHNALKDHHARARKRQREHKSAKPCKGRGNYKGNDANDDRQGNRLFGQLGQPTIAFGIARVKRPC